MTALPAAAAALPRPRLSELDETDRYRRFDELQSAMPQVWESMRQDLPDESVVVVPSVSRSDPLEGAMAQAMEERGLFLLLLLRQPRLRMVYVTSMPVSESTVEYYLGLLPGVIPRHARARLTMLAVNDSSAQPLSAKLLSRPALLRRIRALVPNAARSHVIPYNTTTLERDLAVSLGLPIYGSDPRLEPLGTKSGCRHLFDELGVRAPLGVEDLRGADDIVDAIMSMRGRRPELAEVIVKVNEGVSGAGNAGVDLRRLPEPGSRPERDAVTAQVLALAPEDPALTVDDYLATFAAEGGIVEQRITGPALTSPSVQMRVLPDKTVELLSTHDQLLGGPTGQRYLGCVFPADPAYSRLISEPALRIGNHLSQLGVLGRFAVDFVVVKDETQSWTAYAIELNLRKGGTTHPFLTLQFLTDGTYDGDSGMFLTPAHEARYLVASDHVEHEELKALSVDDLLDVVATHRLHFDQARQTGVVFHMISGLTELGRVGMTAVAESAEHARSTFAHAEALLMEAARTALAEDPLTT